MIEGERVLGRFTVGERIGSGGYGTVHRAWDERLCRSVAVKAVEGETAGRVLREAHAAARLNHPGIVTLYELGNENGTAYLVSELVEGPDLRRLAASGRLSDREVAELGAELCAALTHAHAQGVIHRDLKPDNVLVRDARGGWGRGSEVRAMLADFGIASVAAEPTLTATGQVVGTLAYMAPEQAAGEKPGPAADVYSLALTLYELWAGYNPVAGPTPAATARAIGEPIFSLSEVRPELPPALCSAIDACLTADPAERPGMPELREALLELRGLLHPDRAVPEPEDVDAASTLPPAIPVRPFAVLLGAGAIALLGLLAGLPGLAIAAAILFAPAAILLSRAREWLLPALAPVLGLLGVAPAFAVIAARHPRPAARIVLTALGWAWTGVAGAVAGRSLGAADPGSAAGWAGSGPNALDGLFSPLLSADPISALLIWIGASVLLGILLDIAGPATIAVVGLIWAAVVVTALGAVGGAAAPSALLAPALLGFVGWAVWDRAGRPEIRRYLPAAPAFAPLRPALPARAAASTAPTRVRAPRNPAAVPPADNELRASRAAARHVRAALHGAGSRAGLP